MTLKKMVFSIVFFGILELLFSCNESPKFVTVTSDFEAGGIVLKENSGDSLLVCETKHWIKKDSVGRQFYWFYFKMNNVKDKELKVRLENLKGIYRGKPHRIYQGIPFPVYSYDQKIWNRIKDVHYDASKKVFEFSHKYANDSVWVAYAHPYTYNQVSQLVKRVAKNPLVTIDTVAKTVEDRNIYMLQISDLGVKSSKKKNIYFQALQHSGEMAGGYFIEGMVDYILDKTQSKNILKHYNFFIVPAVNPDGLVHGISRYNINMNDLNSLWFKNIDDIMEPEIKGIRSWLDRWYDQGKKMDHAFDIHCWGQQNKNLYITNNDTVYHEILNRFTPFEKIPSNNIYDANWYFQNLRNTNVTTVELSQKKGLNTNLYSISDFRQIGENFVKAFSQQAEK